MAREGSNAPSEGELEYARKQEQEEKVRAREELQRATKSSLSLTICVVLVLLGSYMYTWSGYLGHIARLWTPRSSRDASKSNLESWITTEKEIAFERLLMNIGPVVGAKDGLVIASPSRGEDPELPDYYYTWTRDSALTISSLLPLLLPPSYLPPLSYHPLAAHNSPRQVKHQESSNLTSVGLLLEPLIRAYISSQAEVQVLETPSGGLWTGGLSEPKFTVDGKLFKEEWGRPQRDGPALRALALIPYANYLLDRGFETDITYLHEHLYSPHHSMRERGSVIKNDLEEVSCTWWEEGFDLWEEVDGHHLFTRLASLRALQLGSALADRLGDHGAADWYADMARKLEQRLANFWIYDEGNHGTGYWASTIFGHDQLDNDLRARTADRQGLVYEDDGVESAVNRGEGYDRTGLDCAFLLCSIHFGTLYPRSTMDWTSFEPSHPGTLGTLHRYITSFAGLYEINERRNWTEGWAVGRYSEDVYDGVGKSLAHPWFICTFSVAHVLYLAYTSFARQGSITISNHTLPLWTDILGSRSTNTSIEEGAVWHATEGGTYESAMSGLLGAAEGYMDVGRRYTDLEGRMSEQINKDDGCPRGARDLTWSYASFLEATRARDEALSYEIG